MSTEPAQQFDPVKYKNTRESWQNRRGAVVPLGIPSRGCCPGPGVARGPVQKTESGAGVLWEGPAGASRHKLKGRRLERVVVNPADA